MAQLLQPKQQLAGYEILELVGKGGMGEVYRARQISMERIVALKILAPRLAKQDPSFARRFVEEARAAGRLNNPNIIAVHDVGKAPMPGDPDAELDYFSMEFVDGESVKDVIERQGGCPLSLVGQVMLGMSEALVYAEVQGIVHRDIKPDNIMLTNGGVVKLADLGLALQLGGEEGLIEKDEKGRGKVMGTPLYMSPEQARALPVDSRSDQYSLGATLYHMLTGKPPFRGENAKSIMKSHVFDPVPDPKTINAEVPELWRQLCMKLMAKNPEERFTTCVGLREAVQAAISGQSGPGPSRRVRAAGWVSSVERTAGMPSWAKLLVYAGAASAVALVVVLIPGGSHGSATDAPKPVVDQLPPPPPNPQARAMERVQAALKALPPEPDKALLQLDALLADQTLPAGPARERVAQEVVRRKAELEQARKAHDEMLAKQRLARADEVLKAMAAGNLMVVKEGLQALASELDKLPAATRDGLVRVKQQFQLALVDVQKQFSDRLLQAKRHEEVDAALAEAKASPLGDEAIAALSELAGKRGAELGKSVAGNGGGAEDRPLWLTFGDQLEALRATTAGYKKFKALAEVEGGKFSADSRELIKVLGDLGEQALAIQMVLRKYMGDQHRPPVDVVIAGKPQKIKMITFSSSAVSYVAVGAGAGDPEQSADRKQVELPLRDILEHTPAEFFVDDLPNAEDRPRAVLAYLWYWRQPEALALAAKMVNEPLAKAITVLESKAHPIESHGKVARAGKQVTVSYDFTTKRPELLADFAGDGITISANGLSWVSAKVSPKGSGEADLPTLRWKDGLLPPLSITAQCFLRHECYLIMFGVAGGGKCVRIGFNTFSNTHKVISLVTKPDGVNFEVGKNPWSKLGPRPYFKLNEAVKIDVAVSTEGKVTLKFNDNVVGDETQVLLPVDKPISPIVQSFSKDEGTEGGMDISQLTITGTLSEGR